MNENDGTGVRRNCLTEALGIDLPAVVVEQRGWILLHVIKLGEEVEERITGLGDENFRARIAEEAEEEAIGFAGAGGENHLRRADEGSLIGVVLANGTA